MKAGDYITYGLLFTYVVLAVVEFASGRNVKGLYWVGATILTTSLLLQK